MMVKEIPGFPRYYAGDDGEIYSRNYKKNKSFTPIVLRKLNLGRQRLNYKVYTLKVDGRHRTQRGHVLVCTAFHGPRPKGMQCSHINDDKENNRPENLIWETDSENKKRKFFNNGGDCGFHNSRACLSEQHLKEVREMLKQGLLHEEIAKKMGCRRTVVIRINTKKRYARCV